MRRDLLDLVGEARRRANRRVLYGGISIGLVPALGAALAIRLAGVLTRAPIGWVEETSVIAIGLAAGLVLYRRRRLDREDAALLLDRRAGTSERCVTGVRRGGRVARDALARLDRAAVRLALDFRPPRAALAVLLLGGALAALHLLPVVGPTPWTDGSVGVEAVVRGVGGGGGTGETAPPDAIPRTRDDEDTKRRVLRFIHEAEAPLADGAAAEELRAARRAIEAGDREAARDALASALARAPGGDGGAAAGAARRIARALDAAGGAAIGRRPAGPTERARWGEDSDLVRRYLLLIDRH